MRDEVAPPVDPRAVDLVDEDGRLEGPFNAFLLQPRLGGPLQALGAAVRYGTSLSDRAREIARRLAAKSPIVMKIGRDAFMRAVDADYRRSVENAAESFALVATTEDCQEGLNAFVEKRTPDYRGR